MSQPLMFYKPLPLYRTPFERSKRGDEPELMKRFNRTSRVAFEYNPCATFVNVLVQLLWHISGLRSLFLGHICEEELCLLCEIGFLFRMLSDMSPHQSASSSNLLRALRGLCFPGFPELIQFRTKLLLGKSESVQVLLQFIFEAANASLATSEYHRFRDTVECRSTIHKRCGRCKRVAKEKSFSQFLQLDIPQDNRPHSFCSLLEASLESRRIYEAQCKFCRGATTIEETSRVQYLPPTSSEGFNTYLLPPLLVVDTNVKAPNSELFWKTQLMHSERRPYPKKPLGEDDESCAWDGRVRCSGDLERDGLEWEEKCEADQVKGSWNHYIPSKFYAQDFSGGLAVHKTEPAKVFPYSEYELVGMIVAIGGPFSYPENLVCEVRSTDKDACDARIPPEHKRDWLVINGVAITRVTEDEALSLNDWKRPLLMFYAEKRSGVMLEDRRRVKIPPNIFSKDINLTGNAKLARERRVMKTPSAGDIVALDSEFISITEDGSKKAVGRVSVVDGSGKVLIDDHIMSCGGEVVHDYMTEFSGIVDGDLCPRRSPKHLTTLKIVYMKLLHLIDRGVVFVGHGLVNDFSMLNIHVPGKQTRDTVQLFRLPERNLMSLRFLAWHLLGVKIQESAHDSIEDAKTTLQLFRKWEELSSTGALDSVLRDLYRTGYETYWKVGDLRMEEVLRGLPTEKPFNPYDLTNDEF